MPERSPFEPRHVQPVDEHTANSALLGLTTAAADALSGRNEDTLVRMLRVVQARIGTTHEGAHDMQYAADIAHQLNNLRCAALYEDEGYAPAGLSAPRALCPHPTP